jgi:hypothetical protein
MSKDKEAWPYRSREPRAHREWRELHSVLRSFPKSSAYYNLQLLERRAFARWMRERELRQTRYLCGERRSPPPESCF